VKLLLVYYYARLRLKGWQHEPAMQAAYTLARYVAKGAGR
jgi:hypothetical protein